MAECFIGGTEKKEWRYSWSKTPYNIGAGGNPSVSAHTGGKLYYSDTITFDEQTKTVTLNNPISIIASDNVGLNLTGKYVGESPSVVLSESAGTTNFGKAKEAIKMWEFYGAWYGVQDVDGLLISVGTISTCVVDDADGAYPSNGLKNGYKYMKLIT